VDGMDKTGGKYENAIEDAIIAMNEPKDASVTAIRDYVGKVLLASYVPIGTVFRIRVGRSADPDPANCGYYEFSGYGSAIPTGPRHHIHMLVGSTYFNCCGSRDPGAF
jgi:hypothetical protein